MQLSLDKREQRKISISVLFVIFITDSLIFATNASAIFTLARRFIPVVLAVFFLLINRGRLPKTVFFVSLSIVFSTIFAGRVFNAYFYITQIALLIFAYYYSNYVDFEEFKHYFIKWMRIIAIVSLIGFLFSDTIRNFSFLPTFKNTVDNYYKTLIFTNIPMSAGLSRRNWGIFWEPGAYQVYLNIALLFSLFSKNKTKLFDSALFIVTALTTMSGASLLPMPFIVLGYLIGSEGSNKRTKIAVVAVLSILLITFVETGYFDEIINKISGGVNEENNSIGYRLGSMIGNITTALRYPFFGASPEVQDEIRGEIAKELTGNYATGNVNTLFAFFSYFGIPVGCFYTVRLIKFTKNFSSNTISRIFVFIALFLATSNENLIASALVNVFLFITLRESVFKKERE